MMAVSCAAIVCYARCVVHCVTLYVEGGEPASLIDCVCMRCDGESGGVV